MTVLNLRCRNNVTRSDYSNQRSVLEKFYTQNRYAPDASKFDFSFELYQLANFSRKSGLFMSGRPGPETRDTTGPDNVGGGKV